MVTALQPLVEMASRQSRGSVTKFRQRTGPKPWTFSRNIAWRWPLAPTTGLWKVIDSSTIGWKPGNEP